MWGIRGVARYFVQPNLRLDGELAYHTSSWMWASATSKSIRSASHSRPTIASRIRRSRCSAVTSSTRSISQTPFTSDRGHGRAQARRRLARQLRHRDALRRRSLRRDNGYDSSELLIATDRKHDKAAAKPRPFCFRIDLRFARSLRRQPATRFFLAELGLARHRRCVSLRSAPSACGTTSTGPDSRAPSLRPRR